MKKTFLSFFLIIIIAASSAVVIFNSVKKEDKYNAKYSVNDLLKISANENSYDNYISDKALSQVSGEEIFLSVGAAVSTEKDVSWKFKTENPGLYYIKITYEVKKESVLSPEGEIYLNGRLPYNELKGFVLAKEYRDKSKPKKDIYGNEITPEQVMSENEISNYIYDYTGVYSAPLMLKLTGGENSINFIYLNDSYKIISLNLEPIGNTLNYKSYYKKHKNERVYNGDIITVEGENASLKSDSVLVAGHDKASPCTSPTKTGTVLLNTVGGYNWKNTNQYIKWNIEVPVTGLYTLSFKVRQNRNVGQKVSRTLYLNGKLPFDEAADIEFDYNSKWQMITLGDSGGEYYFYLEKGKNEITLQATLGKSDSVVRVMDDSINDLNVLYRKLLVVLGSEPDLNKDYKLERTVPELIKEMGELADRLESAAVAYNDFNGNENATTATLYTIVRQLRKMNQNSSEIPAEFSYFKTNIGAMATNQAALKTQPLEIDFFTASKPGSDKPKPEAGFLTSFVFNFREFIYSFIIDYKNIGTLESNQKGKSITVWMDSGRDQSQIMRSLISDSYTPETGNRVKLELVAGGSLLPATVAGVGPDVYIGIGSIIDYSMRNAAYDLTQFNDFDKVAERFHPSTLIPLKYMDGIYGLPNDISFELMFYRTDILKELNLDIPKTWDDVIAMSSVLSANNMSFGLPSGSQTYLLMIKQKGLDIYKNGGITCALDSVESIDVFRYYTNFFNNYGFPITFSLVNRFRTGEIPIAVGPVSLYNSLEISAPEIKGLWDFCIVPGFEGKDGKINNSSICSSTATMLLQQSKRPKEAWEFMKWLTSVATQVSYGNHLESILGTSGRYTSANLEAFSKSLWGKEERKILKEQMEQLTAIELVPGCYYLTRNLDNAFRNVVYYDKKPMDVMYDYVYKINGELTEKRQELGLDIYSPEES